MTERFAVAQAESPAAAAPLDFDFRELTVPQLRFCCVTLETDVCVTLETDFSIRNPPTGMGRS
jgi:hypothetical protein